jgi:hypothetical protein
MRASLKTVRDPEREDRERSDIALDIVNDIVSKYTEIEFV